MGNLSSRPEPFSVARSRSHRFRGITPNTGRVLVKEIQPQVAKESNENITNEVFDKILNGHVRKATVLARGPEYQLDRNWSGNGNLSYNIHDHDSRHFNVYKKGDVVILPDDFDVRGPVRSVPGDRPCGSVGGQADEAYNQMGSKGKSIMIEGEHREER